ncbi:MAG: 4Fe-4S binding protein [Bacteroidaceae bacterium]|nr:4Fe-4S binding protein [Bacteroidaceae bacterium]
MAKIQGAIVVETDRCKGCELCMYACPQNVIAMSDEVNSITRNYAYMAHPEACTGCTNCATICPDGYISVYRVKVEE